MRGNLNVEAIRNENKKPLERSGQSEQKEEHSRCGAVGVEEEENITKEPSETNGDKDGKVHAEFILSVLLVRLGGVRKGFMNLTGNEKEKNNICGHNQQPRNKEGNETGDITGDVAKSVCVITPTLSLVTVTSRGSSTNDTGGRKTPNEDMVKLLEALSFAISADNHLVEVEGDTKSPTKVTNEEEVNNHSGTHAEV